MTAREFIRRAFVTAGILATGETPSADEANDALVSLNEFIDAWSIEKLMIYQVIREAFPLVNSQQAYTMGPSGNFDTARPNFITGASYIKDGNEVEIPIVTAAEWQEINLKGLQSSLPQLVYPEGTYPLEKINVYPIPNESVQLAIYSQKPLQGNLTLDTEMILAPGYAMALRYNFVEVLALEYGKVLDPKVERLAISTKAEIKIKNSKPVMMKSDVCGLTTSERRGNIYSGGYN